MMSERVAGNHELFNLQSPAVQCEWFQSFSLFLSLGCSPTAVLPSVVIRGLEGYEGKS